MKVPDFDRLEKNIIDVVKEEQIKLGYQKEVIRLYYPLSSLNNYLKTNLDIAGMNKTLKEFCGREKDIFGSIEISHEKERVCFCLSDEVSVYVNEHTQNEGFLYDLIEEISRHPAQMDNVIALFHKYSEQVHVERAGHGEFDYLIYFADGQPDEYMYCLTDEGNGHIIYHRYTREDYDDLNL